MDSHEAAFAAAIRDGLASHPDWLNTAFAAIASGMSDALAAADKRASDANMGMLCALSLLKPGRLTPDTLKLLNEKVVGALAPESVATHIERHTRERITNSSAPPA